MYNRVKEKSLVKRQISRISYSDTALNLAVHRQKYHIVNLLLQYRANPNLYNQAGKTALHRAVASYSNENAKQIQALLNVSQQKNKRNHLTR